MAKPKVHHLTDTQLQAIIRREQMTWKKKYDELAMDAFRNQIEFDAAYDYKYFYTATLYILHRDFGYDKEMLMKVYEALNSMFDEPPAFEDMVAKLKDVADIEIVEVSEATLREGT